MILNLFRAGKLKVSNCSSSRQQDKRAISFGVPPPTTCQRPHMIAFQHLFHNIINGPLRQLASRCNASYSCPIGRPLPDSVLMRVNNYLVVPERRTDAKYGYANGPVDDQAAN